MATVVDGTQDVYTRTAWPNQRKLHRTSNGVLWNVFPNAGANGGVGYGARYSTDNGATWNNGGGFAYADPVGDFNNYTPNALGMFIDKDDYLTVAFRDGWDGKMYLRRGTPNAARTAYTWSAPFLISNNTNRNYPDLVVHRQGTGWMIHVVMSWTDASSSATSYGRYSVSSGGTIATHQSENNIQINGNTLHTMPSIDFKHTGDTKTVASVPDIFIGWSAGPGNGIRFTRLAYDSNAGTWGGYNIRSIDAVRYISNIGDHGLNCYYDGSRVMLGGYLTDGTNNDLVLHERNASDTTTTPRTLIENALATNQMRFPSFTYNSVGDAYIFGRADTVIGYRKWVRGTGTLEPFVAMAAADSEYASAKRGYSDNRIEVLYSEGVNFDIKVMYESVLLNKPPYAPTLSFPTGNTVVNKDATTRFQWSFSDPDSGDSQSAFELRYRVATTTTWTTVAQNTTNTFYDAAAGLLTVADYEWQVRTFDSQGEVGPWSASGYFTAASPPSNLSITDPTAGQTIPSRDYVVKWSAPSQASYQIQRASDAAGTQVYSDTLEVPSTSARQHTVTFDTNNRTEYVRVRIKDQTLWSDWAVVQVNVAYTPVESPTMEITPDDTRAQVEVYAGNPGPLAFDGVDSHGSVPQVNLLDSRQASFDNVAFAGTVLPEDRYEIWGTGGGTAAGAHTTASPFLIDLTKLKTDDRHLSLPGRGGNYGSIPDVNLLDADTAHIHQTKGGWQPHSNTTGIMLSSDVAGFDGVNSLRWSSTSAGAAADARSGATNSIPISAGTTYSFSARIWCGTTSRQVGVYIRWADSAGNFIGATAIGKTQGVVGGWVTVSTSGTAPTGATTAVGLLRAEDVAAGEIFYSSWHCFRTGTDATFVPSTRIVGDIDLRIDLALKTWNPPSFQALIDKLAYGSHGYRLGLNGGNNSILFTYESASSSPRQVSISWLSAQPVSGGRIGLRVTRTVADGVNTIWKSLDKNQTWTSMGSTTTDVGEQLQVGSYPVTIMGSGTEGRTYSWEIRDGVDGPVVASYNYANADRGDTALTTPEGHAHTIHQNLTNGAGYGQAEIKGGVPTKAGWLPGAAGNRFSIADTNLLSNKQSVFSGIPTGTDLVPNLTEVWGSGGGTGAGAPGAASPFLINLPQYERVSGLRFPSLAGTDVTAPHHPRQQLTTDFDFIARVAIINWSNGSYQTVISKDSTVRSWQFGVNGSGSLYIYSGTTGVHVSGAIPGATAGQAIWIRATRTGSDIRWYYSHETTKNSAAVTWTEFGTVRVAAATLPVGTDPIRIGGLGTTTQRLEGTVYQVIVRHGPNGPKAVHVNFESSARKGGVTSFTDELGDVWTLSATGVSLDTGPATKAGWLPGVGNNKFSVADVNLLDAISAHRIVGGWSVGGEASATIASTTEQVYFGSEAAKVTFGANPPDASVVVLTKGVTLPAAGTYTISLRVYLPTSWRGDDIAIAEDGTITGKTNVSLTAASGTVTGRWQTCHYTFTSDGTDLSGTWVLRAQGGTFLAGDYFYVDAAILRTGTSTEFVPSHRITGDIDIRAKVSTKDITTHQYLVAKYAGGDHAYILNIGAPRLWWTQADGAAKSLTHTGAVPFTNREPFWIRATLDVDNGASQHVVTLYTSTDGLTWTQLQQGIFAGTTSIRDGANTLVFGSNSAGSGGWLHGALLHAEVRDGIDGPVVAQYDAEQFATTDTSAVDSLTGHTVNLDSSGEAKAGIVDRNTWALSSSTDRLLLDDRSEFDFLANSDFAMWAQAYVHHTTSNRRIIQVGDGFPQANLNATGAGYAVFQQNDGTNGWQSAQTAVAVAQQWRTYGGQREASGTQLRLDIAGTSVAAGCSPTDLSQTSGVGIGATPTGSTNFSGYITWVAIFRRALTAAERTELGNWNGNIASEPRWLRATAVFYTNADDPAVRTAYANNEVANLAAKPDNLFGWNAWQYNTVPGASPIWTMESSTSLTGQVPRFGTNMLAGVLGGGVHGTFLTKSVGITAGQTYTASFDYFSNGSVTLDLAISWIDATGGEIGVTPEVATSVWSNTWTRMSVSGTAPTGATGCSLRIRTRGNYVYNLFDKATIRQGTSTSFIPSTRITGDLDLRAEVALKDWTPGTHQTLVGKRITGEGNYIFRVNTTGFLELLYSVEGSSLPIIASTAVVGAVDRDIRYVRVTLDVDDGAGNHVATFYTSLDGIAWTVLGTPVTTVGTLTLYGSSSAAVEFGFVGGDNPTTGVLQSGEVRDGIDGPIVASYDAENFGAGVGNGASYVDPVTGHSVVLNASGTSGQTGIIDRNTWAPDPGGAYLNLPDLDVLDMPSTESFFVAAGASIPTNKAWNSVISKRSHTGYTNGWHLMAGDSVNWQVAYNADSGAASVGIAQAAGGAGFADRQWHVFAGSRETDINAVRAYVLDDIGNTVKAAASMPDNATTDTASGVRTQRTGEASTYFNGWTQWYAIFRRMLTADEMLDLGTWDGSVANEPSWLRPLAVFYTNADDPLVRAAYENNEVLNLGSATYGELGWNSFTERTLTRSNTATPVVGHMALFTPTPPVGIPVDIMSTPVGTVTPGTNYSASFSVYRVGGDTATFRVFRGTLVWFDSAGGELGRTEGDIQYTGPSEWARVSVSGTAPAGATQVALRIDNNNLATTNAFFFDAVIIREGADTGYLPSFRIRENLDLRADIAPNAWSGAGGQTLIELLREEEGAGYWFYINNAGQLGLALGDSGTGLRWNDSPTAIPLANGTRATVRAVFNSATGDAEFSYSTDRGETWVSLGAAWANLTELNTIIGQDRLYMGAADGANNFLNGNFYGAEVRDGINGPAVLDFDTMVIRIPEETVDDSGHVITWSGIDTIGASDPAITHNEVHRRRVGVSEWQRIATGVEVRGTYFDRAVASRVMYEYKVVAVGTNGSTADSNVDSTMVTVTEWRLRDPQDANRDMILAVEQDSFDKEKPKDIAFFNAIGRKNEIAVQDVIRGERFTLTLATISEQEYLDMRDLLETQHVLIVQAPMIDSLWWVNIDSPVGEHIVNMNDPYVLHTATFVEADKPDV